MSPGEKLAFNLFNLAVFLLFFSAMYYCTPGFVIHGLHRVASTVSGIANGSAHQIEVRKTILREAMIGDHVASLVPGTNTTIGSMPVF